MSLIYETRTLLSDLLRMTFSQRESRSWRSLAYQFASLCLVYALLMQTVPHFAFARSSQSSKPSASKQKTADKSTSDLNKSGAAGTLGNSLMSPPLPSGGSSSASVTDAVITRHKPTFNTGSIDGSLRVLLGESFTINGSTQLIPDLLVPGSPSVVLNGGAQHEGVVNDGGSATPTNYTLTLNGGVKLGKIHTRVDAIQLPTDFPTSVPASGGTRTVTVQSQSAVASIGNWQTVRDLNVNGSNITVDVPPGNYRTFTVNGNSKLKFSAGTYNLANTLTLDGSGSLQTTGVITINVGGSLTINSGAISPGSYTSPGDVQLNVLGTVVNVNGSSQVTALLRAYNATVTLNGTSQVRGQVIADKFILNGGKVIGAVWPALSASCPSIFGPRRFDRTNGPPNQYVEQFSLPPGITSPFTLHIQNGATDGTSRVSSATVKLNGVDLVTPSDLNQNVASLDRTVTLSANNQLDVRVASAPGSYLIINICGTTPATDTTPPLIAITSPGNNTTTTAAEVSVSGTASDTGANASGIAHVYVNGVEAAYNSAAGTWIINNVALNLGAANQINATAVDQAGNQATATISITRESPENQRPTANAGTEQTITLPQTASLHGTASDDGLPSGSTLTVNWTKVSGPGTVTFSSPTALDTTATFSVSGTYVLRLTASDGALTQSSDVTIIVQPQNQPPTVTAGPDQTIALPHTATLNGTVTDDGSPVGGTLTTTWSKVSGPGSVIFEDPLLLQTVATFSEAGPYVLRLTASDSELSSMAEVTINVQPQNQAPSVNAGADQTISLPNGAQLIGSASDDGWPAGSSLSTSWSVVSGPGPVTFANPNATSTVATFNVAGEYILRLTAGDGDLSNYADIKVVVTPPNAAPLVVAGDDQIFSLPQDTTTLNGSMLDDGLPIGSTLVATWSKISGPGTVVFGNANNPTTTAQFSAAGTYKLRLTGTDGALTSFSEVQIRVTPANQAPSVSAGPDQTIALPSSANLNGSTSDDGLPLNSTVTTNWSKVSGPGDVAFAAPSMTVTTASFSAAGTYVLRLTASDSQLSNSAEVTIVVQPENQTPSVNAGIDQTIALPSNATLDGTVTDDGYPTGSSVSVTWSKVSGPGTVTFGNASSVDTTASFSVAGTYVLQLTASDSLLSNSDEVTIVVQPENQAPSVNAGIDQTIALPSNATLDGTVTDDGYPTGSSVSVTWSKVSGPGTVTFGNASSVDTTASFSVAGTYVLQLAASDSLLSNSDEITIVVQPENQAPSVNAGTDQTIALPSNATLDGTVTDDGYPTGSSVSVTWSKVSGPGTVTFGNASSVDTTASFSVGGTYVLQLTASDSLLSNSDEVTIVVQPENQAPSVNAGIDQTIALPSNATLDGTVTDDGYPTGSSVSVTWSKVSGPGTVTFGNASSVDTTASFSVAGTYVLQLTASDSLLSNSDEVTIVVQPENQTPTANAGADQSITLPASASLNGSTSDDGYPSGSTMTVTWSKFSGPGNVTFSSPNTTITSASFSAAGTYVLRLTASDGQLSASDDTTITVIPQNFPPTVNAGADQSVTLPGAASLNGSTTDDGLPAGSTLVNQWSQVSGPGTTVFANASAPVTTASFDLPGTYVLRLTSTDSQLTAFDELTVMVIDPRVPPTANFVVPESTGTAGAFVIAASGATSSAFSADKILDDSNGTFWNAPGSVNQFAKIQFFDQQSVFIDRVRLQSNQGSIGAPNLKDFQVQISSTTSDDASFVTVLNATQLNNGQLQEFMLPGGPTRAKYLKLIFKNNYGSGGSTTLGTFNPVAVGSVDSLLSLPGLANVARMQSPGLIANGASIYSFSYGGGTNNADGLLGYNRGGFFTTNTSNQFAIIQLGGDKVRNLKGVRIATDYNSGFGAPTAVKDFEVWVSATTPDDASFTKVLTAATAMEGHVQTFMFPGGAVPARYVKYVPLTNHSGGATLNTNAFDVVAEDGAQVVGRSGEYEHAPLSAEQAFDGDINTQWLSPNNVATNVWVKVSLADDKTRQVYGFRINPVNNFNVGQRGPKDIDIRVSTTTTDDAAFTTVYSGTLAGTPNGPVQEILLSNPVDAKYVQFFWKNGYSTTVIGVSELEVLSAPDKGSAIVSFTSGSGNVETLLDLDPTNQPWQTPNNSNANVSFTLLMPRGELATFGHIAFRPGIAANGNYGAPKDFQLQVSTTDAADSSFTTAFSGTLVNSIQMQDFYFTPVQARYVRLVLVKGSDFGSFALHNFLIYSSTIIGTTTRFIDRSSDADGQVVSWAWSFGDGTTSTEKHPTHTFAQTGDYTVSLTVTDNSGLTNTYATVYHVVDSIIPDFARSPIIAHEGGENVRFTDIQELLLSSAALRTYNFGDGSALYSQYAKNILKTYDDSGVFHVTLRVGDPIGIAYTVTRDITVLNMPPSVDIDPGKTVVWGEPWTSVPRITDQSSVDRASLQGDWAFGDGQTSTCVNCTNANATVTHAYNLPGTYTAVLTIRDKDGGVGSDNAVFTVNKRPTTVTLLVTQSQNNGDSYLVRAKLTDTYANLALPNKTLQFALNGVTASATTDASGIAEVSFPFAAGAYVGQSAVSFVEDALYLGSGSTFGDPLPPITPPSGASHKGKDFWIVTLDNFNTAFGSVAVDLYLTSEVATSGTVTQQNVTPVNFTIPANGLKKVPAGLENYLFQPDTIQSKGIHIVSQDPISVVSMNNFSFTSDAFLALPAEALGTDYIVLGYANGTNIQGTHFGMVATQNGTSVTITPSVTTGSRLAGVPFVITLNQGQTYYLRNDVAGRENDLSGTLVSASKPVAVFGGHKSGSVPDNVLFADHLVEQLPPTNTWGKHFVTMPYKTRTGGDTFRFMAAGDATSVYVNGQRVALLNRGQFHERIIDGPAYIVSDKPILVAQYSNGAFYDHLTGDPSMAIIPPYEQYLNSYVVANPDFGNVQFLNVIAPTSTVGSVILDGAAIAASTFTPISTSGFSGAQISVARGAHQLTGPSAFGVSVYGFGQDDAYGFPGGMTFRSTVPTTGLVLTPNSSSAAVGTQQCVSASLTDQFGIPVGGQSVVFSVTGANPSNSSGQTNAAGQAGLCYAGANIGLDTITATVGTSQATATIAWTSPNQPPIVNAGADQTITGNSANLLGSVSDDGLPTGSSLTLLWTKVSGPGNVTFGNASFATTTATFTAGGVYVLRLTANDTQLSSSDEVTVTAAAPDARGSDFWLMFPVSSGSADTLTLLISGENETTGTVSAPGIQFVQSFAVHPGTVTQVVIPNTAEQLFTNFVDNKGIHVTAQKDVAVYGLNYHTFTTEGYLGLPVDVLGTEYITLGYKNGGSIAGTLFSLVATANNTVVDITPSVDTHQFINGVDTIVQRAGVTYRINLNQGETYQLVNTANSGDLSGSSISANNPIAVFGGHNCANVPANFVACNHLVEQLPSIDKWGTNFLTVPLAVRTAGDTFRVIASRDNTHVSVNGVVVATLNRGQFDERTLTARSVITADQPIMVAQYSNSFTIDNTDGDPFMMLVPPVEQFASSYTIATPANGFPNNYMNVVVPNAALGSLNLDGSIVPTSSFAPIGSSGYSGAQLSIGVGSHTISNTTSFGAGIYGFASFDTYGYPAGMALSSIALAGRTTLTPRSAFGLPGNQTCLTATVRDQNNNPIANTAVNFNVTGANTTAGTAPTDAFGQAQFCYAGINPGFDAIVATSTSGSDQATRYWQPPNQAPTVNAGPDQHGPVTVCTRQEIPLQGSVTDDGFPVNAPVTVNWTAISGPGPTNFTNNTAASTTATFNVPGTYVLRLTASDTQLSSHDDVQVVVDPAPVNQPPTVDAGPAQTVSMGTNLIQNPSNEKQLVNGEIPDWSEVASQSWTQAPAGTNNLPASRGGATYFYTENNGPAPTSVLSQDVDVSSRPSTAGNIVFSGYLRVRAGVPNASAQVTLEFINKNKNFSLGQLTFDPVTTSSTWQLVEANAPIPAGTAWIRLRLNSDGPAGGNGAGFFDALSLRFAPTVATTKLVGTISDDGLYCGTFTQRWDKISGPGNVGFGDQTSATTNVSFDAPGTYVVRFTGDDAYLTSTSDVTIAVNAAPTNLAPVVNAGANQTITLPTNFVTLSGTVTDDGLPEGINLLQSWSKVSGPGNVAFADASATATTATFSAAGTYVLRLTGDDSALTATSDVTITVNPETTQVNQPPTVNPGPNQSISLPTDTVTLSGVVTDDGLPSGSTLVISWTKVSGPGNVTFGSANSAVTAAQFSAVGSYVLRLSASDSAYLVSADVGVILAPQNFAPAANAGVDQTALLSQPAQLDGSVSDDGLPAGSSVTTIWSMVSGPGTVTFDVPNATITGAHFSATGTYVLRLTANDSQLSGSDDVTITVIDDVAGPTVELTAPLDGDSVTEPTIVTGSVSGGAWILEYSLASDDNTNNRVWTQFASGNGAASGTLGTLDPTMMLNGLFTIRLSATDAYGQTSRTSLSVIVERNLKVGNFTVSFTDLTVPVAGVPMEVTRTYDTRDKRVGDFGFGWTLGLHNIRVEKSSVLGLKWYETVSQEVFPNYCLEAVGSHVVTVTFPGGKVFKFQPTVTPQCQRITPITSANISFAPMTGTVGRLEVVGSSDVQIDGSVPGPVNLIGFGGGVDIFNSFVFKFTAEDGTAYLIDQRSGLQSIADQNGNTVTIGNGGILHSNGKSITFARDGFGRITSITDPNGNSMTYAYDLNGDLVSYTDNENNTSTYTYDANHRLLTIHDPRGIQPIRNDYDAGGRLISHTDGFGKVITYVHDIVGRVESVTDRLGHTMTLEYDERGNIVRKTDARGGVSTFTFDSNDNVLTETNPLNRTTTYTYDANNHRLSITDPLNNITQFTYNAQGRVLTTTDPLGHVITNTFNGAGNVLSSEDAQHGVSTFVYSVFDGQMISMTDALNQTTHYNYTGGYLTKETDALGREKTYTYDANANRSSETLKRTNALGQLETITTGYEYDRLNRLQKTIFADGSTTQVEYNSIGHQSATIDQLGRRTEFVYDEMGRLTRTTYPDGTFEEASYDAEGRRLTLKDRAGHVTSNSYDELGRPVKTTFVDGTFTRTSYDAAGHELSTTDPRGNVTSHTYDAAGRMTKTTNQLNQDTTFTYDGNRNQLSMTDALNHATTYEYDLNNRRTKTIFADSTFSSVAYDALGRTVSKTDQAGKTAEFTYDAEGRLIKVKDTVNQETTYSYDEIGQQISQTDANNHTTRFEYDQLGRRVKRILPGGQFETYAYDNAGNLSGRTDCNGKVSSFSYDLMNRLLVKTPDASLNQSAIGFTYNALGQRVTMNDASGATSYSYDVRNRLTTKQTPFGTLSYTYDEAGNLLTTRSSNQNGASVDYSYDPLNRLSTVKDNHLIGLNGGLTSYAYDTVGNLQGFEYPNGVTTSYVYDTLNRLATTTVGTPVSALASYSYTLGPSGNRTAVTELSGRTVNYTYDQLYRLTSESITNDPHGVSGSITYSYDPVGNRLSRSSSVAPVSSQSSSYDVNDRLINESHDNNGNTTAANGHSYAYDSEDHLVSADGSAVTYVYDGDGNRVKKTVAGITTQYLVDSNNPTRHAQVLDELVDDQVVRTYVYGNSLISQRQLLSGLWSHSFYGYDGQTSVRFLTNTAGVVTDSYTYDAFGSLVATTGSTPNERLYTGEQYDANIGFYNLRSRLLRPDNGRFLTMDSFEGDENDPASLHKYLYVNANPVNFVDPEGYLSNPVIGKAVELVLRADFIGKGAGRLRMGNVAIITILRNRGLAPWKKPNLHLVGALLRPDLIDFEPDPGTGLRSIYEIKPVLGKVLGILQMYTYLGILNGYDPGWGPGSEINYTPPPSFNVIGFQITTFPPDQGVILYETNLLQQLVNYGLALALIALVTAIVVDIALIAASRGWAVA